jgi:hypothetical protein
MNEFPGYDGVYHAFGPNFSLQNVHVDNLRMVKSGGFPNQVVESPDSTCPDIDVYRTDEHC